MITSWSGITGITVTALSLLSPLWYQRFWAHWDTNFHIWQHLHEVGLTDVIWCSPLSIKKKKTYGLVGQKTKHCCVSPKGMPAHQESAWSARWPVQPWSEVQYFPYLFEFWCRWYRSLIERLFCSCCSMNLSATALPEAKLQNILENKGGLDITDYGQFGDLMIGEKRELVIWIQWVTSEERKYSHYEYTNKLKH